MINSNAINKIIFVILITLFLLPAFGMAQETREGTAGEKETNRITNYEVLAPLPGVTGEGEDTDTSDLGPYLKNLFNFFVGLAAILAVFVISLGGFVYISSDSFTGKSQGKEYITNAVTGLLIVLAIYAILFTINPELLDLKFRPGEKDLPGDVCDTCHAPSGYIEDSKTV